MKIQWSSDEEILLHKYLKKGFKYKKIAKLLGRTLVSIKNKIVSGKIKHGKFMDIPKKIKIKQEDDDSYTYYYELENGIQWNAGSYENWNAKMNISADIEKMLDNYFNEV